MSAEYKLIDGFQKHRVGDDGSMWVLARGEWVKMKCDPRPNGYVRVEFQEGGKSRREYVHTLVLEEFKGPRPDGMQAAHGNGIRNDNRLSNLSWKTRLENEADKVLHGTLRRGERASCAKLTDVQILEIIRLAATESTVDLACEFGVSYSTIARILNGESWSHIEGDRPPNDRPRLKCKRGLHRLEGENLLVNKNGYRACRACRDAKNRLRRKAVVA